MKNLFKITDTKITTALFIIFFGAFFTLLVMTRGKVEKVNEKSFTGINAVGQTFNNGELTGTIVNH